MSALKLTSLALASAALGLSLGLIFSDRDGRGELQHDTSLTPTSNTQEGSDLDTIGESLREVRISLERIEGRMAKLEDSAGRTTERVPVVSSLDETTRREALAAGIARIERSVKELSQELRARSEADLSLSQLKRENAYTKWGELQGLIDHWHQDNAGALDSIRLLSMEDVIRRYGSPTEIWSNDKGLNWIYGEGKDPAGGYLTEVWLRFNDGYVMRLGVKVK